MKNVIILICGLFMSPFLSAQTNDFSNCAAVYLNDQMLISEYSPRGVSEVAVKSEGRLQLRLITMPDQQWEVSGPAQRFQVAIRDKKTGTLVMYSEKIYRSLPIEEVLALCKPGDHILIMALDRSLGLSGGEIKVK